MLIAVIGVKPGVKYSFVYKGTQTRPIGQCHMQNAWQGTIGKIQNIMSRRDPTRSKELSTVAIIGFLFFFLFFNFFFYSKKHILITYIVLTLLTIQRLVLTLLTIQRLILTLLTIRHSILTLLTIRGLILTLLTIQYNTVQNNTLRYLHYLF